MFLKKAFPFLILFILSLLCVFYIKHISSHPNYLPDVSEISKFTLAHSYYYGYTDEHRARNKDFYPPLYFVSSVIVNKIFFKDFSFFAALSVNVFYFLLTAVALYFIVRKLSRKQSCALYSLAAFSLLPGTIYFSCRYVPEISLMAAVSLSLWCFIYCDNFKNKYSSILLGVTCAFGMLCKWTFIFYVAVPILISIYHARAKRDNGIRRNIVRFFVITIAGCGWWYAKNFNFSKLYFVFKDSLRTECSGIENGYLSFLFHNAGKMFFLLKEAVSLPCMIFLFLLVFFIFFRLKKTATVAFLGTWLIPGIILYIFLPTDCNFRYLPPFFPIIVMILLLGFNFFPKKIMTAGLISILCIFVYTDFLSPIPSKPLNTLSTPEYFLISIMTDAQKKHISNPLIGLDAFHDPGNIIQDLYFSLWFYKIKKEYAFEIFYRDIEMLAAADKETPSFSKYSDDFTQSDYIVRGQNWQGWNENFSFLGKYPLTITDDLDKQSFNGEYFVYVKRKSYKVCLTM